MQGERGILAEPAQDPQCLWWFQQEGFQKRNKTKELLFLWIMIVEYHSRFWGSFCFGYCLVLSVTPFFLHCTIAIPIFVSIITYSYQLSLLFQQFVYIQSKFNLYYIFAEIYAPHFYHFYFWHSSNHAILLYAIFTDHFDVFC